ncbi:MAG: SEC-C metal-binding domain-containing protein, partial [Gammaproteobacteria bacterium]
ELFFKEESGCELDDLVGDSSHYHYHEPYHRETPKIGRNDPCHCGSGKKYKKCCLSKEPITQH